jgi:TonB family protein
MMIEPGGHMQILQKTLIAGFICLMAPHCFAQAQGDETIPPSEINVLEFEPPKYPPLAHQTRTQGLVVVRAKLDAGGRVTEATALSGHALLVAEAVANIRKWQFQPNAHHAVVVVYEFKLSDTRCSFPSGFFELEVGNLARTTACPSTLNP